MQIRAEFFRLFVQSQTIHSGIANSKTVLPIVNFGPMMAIRPRVRFRRWREESTGSMRFDPTCAKEIRLHMLA